MRILILLILAASLSCCGENKEQVFASCRLQYTKSVGSTLFGDTDWYQVGLCMKAHGFTVVEPCPPDSGVPACWKPMTLEKKIRALFRE
jgi:hypothetical protein